MMSSFFLEEMGVGLVSTPFPFPSSYNVILCRTPAHHRCPALAATNPQLRHLQQPSAMLTKAVPGLTSRGEHIGVGDKKSLG